MNFSLVELVTIGVKCKQIQTNVSHHSNCTTRVVVLFESGTAFKTCGFLIYLSHYYLLHLYCVHSSEVWCSHSLFYIS